MKKTYITPAVEICSTETVAIIAASPSIPMEGTGDFDAPEQKMEDTWEMGLEW